MNHFFSVLNDNMLVKTRHCLNVTVNFYRKQKVKNDASMKLISERVSAVAFRIRVMIYESAVSS